MGHESTMMLDRQNQVSFMETTTTAAASTTETEIVGEEKKSRMPSSRRSFRLFRRARIDHHPSTVAGPAAEQEQLISLPAQCDYYDKFTQPNAMELQSRAMVVHPRAKTKKEFKAKREIVLDAPPTARQAAFGGPVRYDWIDIETCAALKVQAAYRRNKVMNDLERQGITTGAIRNRARRRMANSSLSFLDCCGWFSFNFADFSVHDREAHREYQKMLYQEQKKTQWDEEEKLRFAFSRNHKAKQEHEKQEFEAIEVVD